MAQSWRLKALNLGSTANTMFPKPGGEVSVKSSFMDDRASMTPPDPAGRNLSTSLVLEDTLGGMGAVPARGRADHGSGSTELSRQRRTLSRPRTKLPELSGLLLARECNSDWTECSIGLPVSLPLKFHPVLCRERGAAHVHLCSDLLYSVAGWHAAAVGARRWLPV